MLKVHSQGLFRRGYRVTLDGRDRALITPHRLRSGSEVVLDDTVYDLSRPALLTGDYVFTSRGRELARGRKTSFAGRGMRASFAGQAMELEPQFFRSKYQLVQDGRVVGHIGPRPILNSYAAAMPPTIPLVYQVFLIGLVAVRWTQDGDGG